MSWSAAQRYAQMAASGKMNPSSLTTLTDATFTPGATPAMPTPLMAPAIVPATWVPWSEVVGLQAATLVSTTPPRHEALCSNAICEARSGCVGEMPESSTPTTTDGSPVVTECASATSICAMSHCEPQSGSAVGSPAASMAAASTASLM